MKVTAMPSSRSSPHREAVTPVEASLAGAVVAYLLSAAVLRDFGSAEAAATLLRLPAVAIAAVVVIATYVWLWFSVSPKRTEPLSGTHKHWKEAIAESIVAENQTRESIAAASRWWHHLLGAAAGGVFGALLAWVLVWLFA